MLNGGKQLKLFATKKLLCGLVVNMDETKKKLLTFGFVREFCNAENMVFLPNDIVELFVLWLIFCDRIDINLCHEYIELTTKTDDKYGEYQQIGLKEFSYKHSTAICEQIIKKGNKQLWTFKFEEIATDTYVILGIIDNNIAIKEKGGIRDFSVELGGYGLYLSSMRKYAGEYSLLYAGGGSSIFGYGQRFRFKKNDMITMELDLTKQKGVLSFTFHAEYKSYLYLSKDLPSNVAYNDVDVDKQWRGAVAICDPELDIVSLLPYNPIINNQLNILI